MGVAAALPLSTASAGTSGATFGVPRVVDPIHVYGEPDIAVNPRTGAVHVSGPQGTGTQRSVWNVSVDGGDSYRLVQDLPQNTMPTGFEPSKSDLGPGGGDTEIAIAHNGRTFYNDLYALTCFTAATTPDDGATTASSPLGCDSPPGDRQWMALFDPQASDQTVSPYDGPKPLVYMTYNDQLFGDRVDMSTNGVTYTTKAGEYGDTSPYSPNHGTPVVDQHTGDFLGLVAKNSTGLSLAVGTPAADGTLTFHYNDIADSLPGDPQTLFPILTEDTARNLYAVWVQGNDFQTYYSTAAAASGWSTWTAPRQISRPPSNVNVFPWAQAGGPGILDVAWYGTDRTLSQLGPDGPSAHANQAWDVYFAQVTGASGSTPTVAQARATPHPMHYNDICLLGTACITEAGNRNLADFFKLTIGPDGRARIVYADTSNGLSQTGGDSAADHSGAAVDTVVMQQTGTNAWTGRSLSAQESTAPRTSVTDPSGDALFKPLGGTPLGGADISKVMLGGTSGALKITVTTTGGSLADAALGAKVPDVELVVRWQQGNKLFHAGIEQGATDAAPTYYAGATSSVDLCSVSGCKPNYLQYGAPPIADTATVPGSTSTSAKTGARTYTLTVPRALIGNPTSADRLEEVTAFVTVSPTSSSVQLDSARAQADEVPVQVEGTRPFTFASTAFPKGTAAAGA
ncbi:MAG: hypothetical protein QOE01_1694, partial [Actinomycetota bacterium]|nr:hypothetical protein [Actinomycetota bacterium]